MADATQVRTLKCNDNIYPSGGESEVDRSRQFNKRGIGTLKLSRWDFVRNMNTLGPRVMKRTSIVAAVFCIGVLDETKSFEKT